MDTGQLFMQLSARAKVDFAMPVNSPITSKPAVKSKYGSFDGVLKEVDPQRHSKNEQATRAETKRPMLKSVERAGEPDNQKPAEIQSTSRNRESLSDYDKKTEAQNDEISALSDKRDAGKFSQNVETDAADKPELKLPEKSNVISIPQNVDTPLAVAMVTFAQPLSEGRMPQSVVTEDNTSKADGLVRAQNAIPELQFPEGKALAKAELDLSGENSGTQIATNAFFAPSMEVAAEILTDKNQLQAELLVQNADSKVVLMQQPVNLRAGMLLQETKTTEIMVEQLPLASAIETKQKAVTSQEPVKVLPVDVPVDTVLQDSNDVLLQAPVRSQVSAGTAEFRFSRSASVEASLGMVSVLIDQPVERLSVSVSDSAKAAHGNSVPETVSAELSGSGSGFMGKDNGGFGQQNLDLPKPGLQQMTNGQVVSSVNVSTGNVEQTDSQQTRMASSENIAGQVKAQLSTREIKQGAEQITIQLSPDHLGNIKVNFRMEDQRLRVEIVVENRSARESLLQHADSLKESLARQNINMEKFEVTGGNSGSANQGGNSQTEWREMAKNRQSQQWLTSGGYRTQPAESNPSLPVYFARAEKSTLDLHF